MLYDTIYDLINFEIIPALGAYADDFDIDAIADDIIERVTTPAPGIDGERGAILVRGTGYRVREDIDFWDIAARHEK